MIIVALLMKKSKISHIISLIIGGVIIAGIFFYIGYRTAYIRYENAEPAIITQTFYATISEITEDTVTVTGMDVNDINFRGEFVFGIEKETEIIWRYTDIAFSDLDTGDKIAITFAGEIMDTYPMQITQVEQIQLLDDEL